MWKKKIGEEEIQLLLFACDMIVYLIKLRKLKTTIRTI